MAATGRAAYGLSPAPAAAGSWPAVDLATERGSRFAVAVVLRRRYPALAAAWLVYLVTLLPVSGLLHVGTHIAADRYTYLPSIGVALIVVYAARELIARHIEPQVVEVAGVSLLSTLMQPQPSFYLSELLVMISQLLMQGAVLTSLIYLQLQLQNVELYLLPTGQLLIQKPLRLPILRRSLD